MFNRYRLPPWLRRLRDGLEFIILPLAVFQLIRTLLFPSTLDVIFLALLAGIYVCFLKRWF